MNPNDKTPNKQQPGRENQQPNRQQPGQPNRDNQQNRKDKDKDKGHM